jgi:hypothetical protein
MAIVKAYFTRSSEKIMKTLNYIVHRPGKEGEKLNRELFGDLEESIRKEDAYGRIAAGQGMTFFHLKFNFHPEREDTRKDLNLRDITRGLDHRVGHFRPPSVIIRAFLDASS